MTALFFIMFVFLLVILCEIFLGRRLYIVAGFAEEGFTGRGIVVAYHLYARNLEQAVDQAWEMLYNGYPTGKYRNHVINIKVLN